MQPTQRAQQAEHAQQAVPGTPAWPGVAPAALLSRLQLLPRRFYCRWWQSRACSWRVPGHGQTTNPADGLATPPPNPPPTPSVPPRARWHDHDLSAYLSILLQLAEEHDASLSPPVRPWPFSPMLPMAMLSICYLCSPFSPMHGAPCCHTMRLPGVFCQPAQGHTLQLPKGQCCPGLLLAGVFCQPAWA